MHHITALSHSLECVAPAGHAELVDYCQMIVNTQTMGVQRMRAELASEYGLDFDTPIPGEEEPEPAAVGLLRLGVAGLDLARRRRAASA